MESILSEMMKTEKEAMVAARKELEALETNASSTAEEIHEKRKEYFKLGETVGAWHRYLKANPERAIYLWISDYVHETKTGGKGHETAIRLAKELNVDEESDLFKRVKTLSPKEFVKSAEKTVGRPRVVVSPVKEAKPPMKLKRLIPDRKVAEA